MTHCEKCIHYELCKSRMDSAPDDTFSFFPNNEDCPHFKNKTDYAEVKHGHWVKHSPDVAAMRAFHKLGIGKGMSENSIFWTCSCCDSWGSLTQKYCNQCGAKMDGGIICKT